jgi:hypothetical protein
MSPGRQRVGLPIILLRTIRPGVFVPVFPAYVVHDDSANRRFLLGLDQSLRLVADPLHLEPIERVHAERAMKQRLHQPGFRAVWSLSAWRPVVEMKSSRISTTSVGHSTWGKCPTPVSTSKRLPGRAACAA